MQDILTTSGSANAGKTSRSRRNSPSAMVSHTVLRAILSLSVVAVALAVSAPAAERKVVNKLVSLPIARRYNLTGTNLVKSDQARAKYLQTQHLSRTQDVSAQAAKNAAAAIGVGITNVVVSYVADVCSLTLGRHSYTFDY